MIQSKQLMHSTQNALVDKSEVHAAIPKRNTIAELLATAKPSEPETPIPTGPPKIDYYKNAEGWKPSATCTLPDLIEGIQSDEFRERVERIRELIEAGEKKQADDLKRLLPAVSLSGCINGRRRGAAEQGRFTHSGFLQIDLDAKDHPGLSLDDMRDQLFADPHIQAIFVSPSGNGVKGVARIPADAASHKAAFLTAERHFAAIGLKIDPSCKDPVRLCFVSFDPDAWLRSTDAVEFVIDSAPDIEIPASKPATTCEEVVSDDDDDTDSDDDDEECSVSNHVFSAKGGLVIRATSNHREWTLETIREMLACIPYPGYDGWLKITNAVWDAIGEAGTVALQEWAPEKHPGDYAKKWKVRLKDVHAGSLVMAAKEHGWKPTRSQKKAISKEVRESVKISALLAYPKPVDGSTPQKFRPEDIFYDAPCGKYLVKIGKSFFTFGRKGPVVTGLTRHFAPEYKKAQDLAVAATTAIASRELDGAVQWAGSIAGHRRGLAKDSNGLPILITSQAEAPEPIAGNSEILTGILTEAFSNTVALQVFMSWMATRYRAVREHVHVPSPMLVLAGEVNSGKSLIAWIISQLLGGRTANPYAAWTGGILWNDDLVGSELLLVDDCVGSTDIRARRNFGASFKEAIYPHVIQLRKRNVSSLAVRPVWCVVVCCNDTPESMQIIPPLDADLLDKVALLHVDRIALPIETSSPAGRAELQRKIQNELPAFADQLMNWETPTELRDSRSGVLAWRDPDLAEAVDTNSPARRLEGILDAALVDHGIWHDVPCELTSAQIEARLLEIGSPVRDQAKTLFSWHGACGVALAKLARSESQHVTLGEPDKRKKVPRYMISR